MATFGIKTLLSRKALIGAVVAVVAILVLAQGSRSTRGPEPGVAEVQTGPLRVWATYDGTLEARNVRYIFAGLGGGATIVELMPEGTEVKQGDLLVRLDASDFERNLVRAEKEYKLAKAELDSQVNAQLPLALRELEMKLLQTRAELAKEEQYLTDTKDLVAEGLVAEQEIKQQEEKVGMLRMQEDNLKEQLTLTRDHLHPSVVERSEANLVSAQRDLELTRAQISNCTIFASADGYIAYRPLHVGGEFRTARVGDSIFRNQAFMAIPDMRDLIVQVDVPESEMSMVQPGLSVTVEPLAYPDVRLEGTVETVASMAQARFDRPDWQKFIRVVIAVKTRDERLRSGMSIKAHILSYDNPSALLVPRSAVRWENEQAVCEVKRGRRTERRTVQLGKADDQHFAVESGLQAGDRVIVP